MKETIHDLVHAVLALWLLWKHVPRGRDDWQECPRCKSWHPPEKFRRVPPDRSGFTGQAARKRRHRQ